MATDGLGAGWHWRERRDDRTRPVTAAALVRRQRQAAPATVMVKLLCGRPAPSRRSGRRKAWRPCPHKRARKLVRAAPPALH